MLGTLQVPCTSVQAASLDATSLVCLQVNSKPTVTPEYNFGPQNSGNEEQSPAGLGERSVAARGGEVTSSVSLMQPKGQACSGRAEDPSEQEAKEFAEIRHTTV